MYQVNLRTPNTVPHAVQVGKGWKTTSRSILKPKGASWEVSSCNAFKDTCQVAEIREGLA